MVGAGVGSGFLVAAAGAFVGEALPELLLVLPVLLVPEPPTGGLVKPGIVGAGVGISAGAVGTLCASAVGSGDAVGASAVSPSLVKVLSIMPSSTTTRHIATKRMASRCNFMT